MLHKKSLKRGKARKAFFNANADLKRRFMSSALSKEMKQKYGLKSFPIHKDDMVLVTTGKFKGNTGKVVRVNRSSMRVEVEGCTINRITGGIANVPIHPSNLVINHLEVDEYRQKAITRRKTLYYKVVAKYQ